MTRRDTLKFFGLLGLRTIVPADFGRAAVPAVEDTAMAAATAEFGCDLFAKLRSKSGNLFFSPFSIETALAMTATGARGETRAEMDKLLHLDGSGVGVGAFLRGLQAAPGAKYQLAIANALWGQQGMPFRQEFLAETNRDFGATLHPVDFRQPENARQTINHWVEEQTKDKIKNLFGPGTLDKDNRLVLTNAIYFKGAWRDKFDRNATRDEPFQLSGGSTVQAPLMRRHGKYRYIAEDNFQAVDMPYSGDRVAMTVILPAEGRLSDVESKLTAPRLAELNSRLAHQAGEVLLPRFKTTDEFDLGDTLQQMGMRRAFTRDAEFGGMCAEPLLISKVVHKAFVETNEEGSEAAAATGVGMKVMAAPAPREPFVFRADRPFLFVIRDIQSNAPLFVGRVANPVA